MYAFVSYGSPKHFVKQIFTDGLTVNSLVLSKPTIAFKHFFGVYIVGCPLVNPKGIISVHFAAIRLDA